MESDHESCGVSRVDMSLGSASDDSGDLERSLDEALAEDNSKFSPVLVEEPDQPEPPKADGAAFHKAASPADCRPVAAPVVSSREPQSGPRLNEVAFDMWIRQKRACSLRLPWERNVAAKVFGFKEPRSMDLPQIGRNVSLASSSTSSECETPSLGREFAKKRLRMSSMMRSEDLLLTINPENSFLGSTLADKAILLRNEDEISSSFCDAFADKRAGTLIKTASSCWGFVKRVIQQGHVDPLSVGEPVFYAYMGHLRENGAPTTATCFIES